jgi:nucleoside-diphosphate-sugar epimerase
MERGSILVTGGCGYLGSQLLRDLASDGAFTSRTIRVLDNMDRGSYRALFDLPGAGNIRFLEADLLDPASLRFAMAGIETVVHLAAIVATPVHFSHDRAMEQVNHWGTANLASACVECGVARLVYASSHAVYGAGGPHAEDDACRPAGSYAMSVRSAELAVLGAAGRGLRAQVLRFGSFYGDAPVARFDNVVNRFAILAALGKPVTVYGSGRQRRPVLSVDDASAALRFVLKSDAGLPDVVNVAEANPSVLEMAEAIRRLRPDTQVHFTEQDVLTHLSFEMKSHVLEARGWRPAVTLEEGLGRLMDRFGGVRAPRLARVQ